ncbi:MAG: O-antigen ligase family protein [Bacteroidetes bacterium]|nr:O-antigen ligase family protein [Bacteroidota bacterium]
MNKNSVLNNKVFSKSNIAVFLAFAMLVGFLLSRAILSMAMIAFVVNAVRDVHPRYWFRQKWWWLGLLWVAAYGLSYFWSHDKIAWSERFQVKLPILLFPFAFAFMPKLSSKQLQWFTVATAALFLGGACYSVYPLIGHVGHYVDQYAVSHLLPTPAEDDHILFSLSVTLFIVWCVYIFPYLSKGFARWFVGITAALLSVYLHILAARTGLFLWYVFVLFWAVYMAVRKNKWVGIGIITALIVFCALAITYIPTFRMRIGYMSYMMVVYKQGEMSADYSDMGRWISYDLAIKAIRQHPWAGVGAGDMMDTMRAGYARYYPGTKEEQVLLPHNQFLTVSLACGIPVAFLFALWVFTPLTWLRRHRGSFFFFMAWLILFVQSLVDPVLEVQYGVFVYLFFLLWQGHDYIERPALKAT